VKGLRKVFKFENQTKEAVKNVDMDIYKNQITVLLGHNGAGKTTTMNIISGMIPKTFGTICVDGEDDVNIYRSKLGFCPQHNVFLRYLTCQQHLQLFGILRGLDLETANAEATKILVNVGMIDKKNEFGNNLSGGMKRRLCLANAIIGETKILILDEPTSGLDPESRREIWDILLKLKKNHTILITTHFMEEADVLGDKIAIMEHGEIIAFGTSIFLKNHYGSGYILKILKGVNFKEKEVTEILDRHLKDVSRKQSVEPVYCVTLPYSGMDKYAELLKELEKGVNELGIDSISITNTNLEEVFLK
jgi:ABC-type multidrug transport system ATPase subunit